MGSMFGGPKTVPIPAPTPNFPGLSSTYTNAIQNSGISSTAFNTLNTAAQTGLPTDVGPAFDALKAAMQRSTDEGRTNLRESYGAAGLSGGSDMLKAGADFEAQNEKNLNSILAQYTMNASEAAANRQVSAASTGAQLASEPALSFHPTATVVNQQGMLGGLMNTFSTLFPNFDLSQIGSGLGSVFGAGGAGAIDAAGSYAVDPELALMLAGL